MVLPVPGSPFTSNGRCSVTAALTATSRSRVAIYFSVPLNPATTTVLGCLVDCREIGRAEQAARGIGLPREPRDTTGLCAPSIGAAKVLPRMRLWLSFARLHLRLARISMARRQGETKLRARTPDPLQIVFAAERCSRSTARERRDSRHRSHRRRGRPMFLRTHMREEGSGRYSRTAMPHTRPARGEACTPAVGTR